MTMLLEASLFRAPKSLGKPDPGVRLSYRGRSVKTEYWWGGLGPDYSSCLAGDDKTNMGDRFGGTNHPTNTIMTVRFARAFARLSLLGWNDRTKTVST
jgi:hypothetical protein